MIFKIYFLIRFIPEVNDNIHMIKLGTLRKRNRQPGTTNTTIIRRPLIKSDYYKNILKTSVVLWKWKSCYVI